MGVSLMFLSSCYRAKCSFSYDGCISENNYLSLEDSESQFIVSANAQSTTLRARILNLFASEYYGRDVYSSLSGNDGTNDFLMATNTIPFVSQSFTSDLPQNMNNSISDLQRLYSGAVAFWDGGYYETTYTGSNGGVTFHIVHFIPHKKDYTPFFSSVMVPPAFEILEPVDGSSYSQSIDTIPLVWSNSSTYNMIITFDVSCSDGNSFSMEDQLDNDDGTYNLPPGYFLTKLPPLSPPCSVSALLRRTSSGTIAPEYANSSSIVGEQTRSLSLMLTP